MKNASAFPENLCQDLAKRTYLNQEVSPAAVLSALEQFREDVDPQDILMLHYRDGKTLTQIGNLYGLTPERIRQKRNIGLWKLRRLMFPSVTTAKGENHYECH